MLYITHYTAAKDFHNALVRCWLLIKINGKHSNNNPDGHNCGKTTCPTCTIGTQKHAFPIAFTDFIKRKNNLDILISGSPNDLRLLSLRYKKITLSDNDRKSVKNFFLESAYENWFQKKYGFEFLGLLNFNTCVYCNRNYTRTINNYLGKKVLISQMDHWFPKEKYPLLSISFYNLIPCCPPCNTSIKESNKKYNWDRALRHMVHPYLPSTGQNFTFSFVNRNASTYNVRIDALPGSKIFNTLKFFKIEEVYNSHSDLELKSLLDLRYKYSENYVDSLINIYFNGIMDVEEIYRNVFGIEVLEKDYHKRSLNKFKHDIILELLQK